MCFQVNYARLRNGDLSPGSKAGDDVSRHRRSDCRTMETFRTPTATHSPTWNAPRCACTTLPRTRHRRPRLGGRRPRRAGEHLALELSTMDSLPANSSRPERRGECASPRAARPLCRTDASGERADAGRDPNPRRVAPGGVAACQARRTRRRACPSREEKRPANQGDRRPSHAVSTLLISQGAV